MLVQINHNGSLSQNSFLPSENLLFENFKDTYPNTLFKIIGFKTV